MTQPTKPELTERERQIVAFIRDERAAQFQISYDNRRTLTERFMAETSARWAGLLVDAIERGEAFG